MLIDTHCHILNPVYKKTPEQIFQEARSRGVEKLVHISASLAETKEALAQFGASRRPNQGADSQKEEKNIYITAGIYPHAENKSSATKS